MDVVISGSAGVPTELLLDAVRANILGTGNDDEKEPINDDVVVKGPTPVAVDYTAELELTGGDPADIVAEAENRIRALFSTLPLIDGIAPLAIGQDAMRDRLNWAVMLPDVKAVNTLFADIPVAADGLAVLNSLNITWVWAAEI